MNILLQMLRALRGLKRSLECASHLWQLIYRRPLRDGIFLS